MARQIFNDIRPDNANRYQVRWPSDEYGGRYITAYWTPGEIQASISSSGDPGIETLVVSSDGVNITEKWVRITYLSQM